MAADKLVICSHNCFAKIDMADYKVQSLSEEYGIYMVDGSRVNYPRHKAVGFVYFKALCLPDLALELDK